MNQPMTELVYINVHGDRVIPAEIATKHKPLRRTVETLKRTDDRSSAKRSDGFAVSGYSPEQLSAAEREHKAAQTAQGDRIAKGQVLARGERIIMDWSVDRFMRDHKPKRVRNKPYEIESAADQCAELARKAGWLEVRVEELMKA